MRRGIDQSFLELYNCSVIRYTGSNKFGVVALKKIERQPQVYYFGAKEVRLVEKFEDTMPEFAC
jgi:hypothetical protein